MAGLQGDWDPASVSLDEVSPPRRQLSELFVHVNAQDDNIWCPFVLAKVGCRALPQFFSPDKKSPLGGIAGSTLAEAIGL